MLLIYEQCNVLVNIAFIGLITFNDDSLYTSILEYDDSKCTKRDIRYFESDFRLRFPKTYGLARTSIFYFSLNFHSLLKIIWRIGNLNQK